MAVLIFDILDLCLESNRDIEIMIATATTAQKVSDLTEDTLKILWET